ncbi:MAG: DNA internalization-related competence protein ComEC/Rec2, partial [Deltaproteobacteria bacterium]
RIPALVGRWGARQGAALAAFPVAFMYGLLTGMGLPAIRATLMLAVLTAALVLKREKDLVNSILLAGLLILILSPAALFSASFQLSFIAVTALAELVPRLPMPDILKSDAGQEEEWRRWLRRAYQFICASWLVTLYTAPIGLYHFHRLTPAGLFANLLVVPLVCFLVLPAGLLALCLSPLSSALAGFVLTIGSLGLAIVVKLAGELSSVPWAAIWPGTPRAWQVALVYVLLWIPFTESRLRWRACLLVSGIFVLLVSWTTPGALLTSEQSELRVTYLDVSQGNSAVVELPGKRALIIDGGGFYGSQFDVGRHVVAPYLWHRRIRRLEAMVLSHPHPDHFRGLPFIATHFHVKQFWYNGVSIDDPDFKELMNTLARNNVRCLGPGQLPFCQNLGGVQVQVLHPRPGFYRNSTGSTDRQLNNLSLVLRLNYRNTSFLFPGDIEKQGEYQLISYPELSPVDVLLAPHHGSRTSSSVELLRKLKPGVVVFSVGAGNRFHLPATQVLERYQGLGVRSYRTDRHGAVTICTDGDVIRVETFLTGED